MGLRSLKEVRRPLLLFVYAALVCRLLIPAGYMPAALGEGWPIQVCDSGFPQGPLSQDSGHDDHHDHHDPDGSHELAWEHCSFGVLLSLAAIDGDSGLQVPFPDTGPAFTLYTPVSLAWIAIGFNSRAPPRSSLI